MKNLLLKLGWYLVKKYCKHENTRKMKVYYDPLEYCVESVCNDCNKTIWKDL